MLFTGIAGLLAGALSMGAGEYVSVRSQRELLEASRPDPASQAALAHLDVDANELALVYRARGHVGGRRGRPARRACSRRTTSTATIRMRWASTRRTRVGSAWGAAISSFLFFASGALIPVLPYLVRRDRAARRS